MMALWLYPLPNGNGDIRLWLHQVPVGHYDLYLYGHGNLDDLVGVFEVTALEQNLGTKSVTVGPGWRTDTLQENVHYVVFRDVPSDGIRPVVVTVKPSPHGEAVLNGLQLVQNNALPPSATTLFQLVENSGIQPDGGESPGAAWGDFDGDGKPDLFVNSYGGIGRLYRNRGDGTFEPLYDALPGLGPNGHGCSWGDFDSDGRLDLLVAKRNNQPSEVYRNLGDRAFERLPAPALPQVLGDTVGAAWGDYDGDGFLDFFQADLSGYNRLWRNTGSGTLVQVNDSPVRESSVGVGCAWGDYDNDGDLDLFVANGGNRNNSLFRNDAGTFTKVAAGDIVSNASYSVGSAWGDYDNDGDLDLYVANRLGPNFLYRNDGVAGFTRITEGAIVTDVADSNGCTWADYDNDGDLDLFVANFTESAVFIYRNNGNGMFHRETAEPPAQPGAYGSAVILADYDGNGFLDLFVAKWSGGSSGLYRNRGSGSHWLLVRLDSSPSGRTPLGARVKVKTLINGAEHWQMRELVAYDGWGGTSADAHFGLGPATVADTVIVTWPWGESREFREVPADQILMAGSDPNSLLVEPAGGGVHQ
jgi:hypothetical protein